MLKIAIVGCGKIADAHAAEIQKLPSAGLVAVCDAELLMAEQLAVRFGIARHYDDFRRMLAENHPDVVHITTPPSSHLALARQAFEAGSHVFAEKPLAPCFDDCRKIVDAAAAAGKKLTIGHIYSFDPATLKLRKMFADGVLGEIVHIESYYGYDLAGPFGAALLGDTNHWVHRLPGKLFQNVIDHVLNRIVEFLPEDQPCIHATAYRSRPARGDESDGLLDELRVVILGQRTSAYATFCSNARPVAQFIRVYGTRNIATVDYVGRTVVLDSHTRVPGSIGRLWPPLDQARKQFKAARGNFGAFLRAEFQYFAGLNHLIREFYHSIQTDGPPPIPYADILRLALWMDEIIHQVYPSVAEVRA
jgi:predicted dehydrogenase